MYNRLFEWVHLKSFCRTAFLNYMYRSIPGVFQKLRRFHKWRCFHVTGNINSTSLPGRSGGGWLTYSEGYFREGFPLIDPNWYFRFNGAGLTQGTYLFDERRWALEIIASIKGMQIRLNKAEKIFNWYPSFLKEIYAHAGRSETHRGSMRKRHLPSRTAKLL